jgi:ribosome-associated protein YbcJ (S4-like RNA binding protein)
MKIRAYIFVVVFLVLFVGPRTWADSTASREYQVKAAFLYNFIKFVDWPKEKVTDPNAPLTIGIIGKDPFEDAFEPLQEKAARDRKVVIQRFEGFVELEKSGKKKKDQPHPKSQDIQKCHLLFICPSESERIADIIASVKGHSVLTVADTQGFLESGGIINFIMEEQKVRFEINVTNARRAKLQIRSQLLRLAKRVIDEKDAEGNKNK